MEEIINIFPIDPQTLEFQDYNSSDESLISNFEIETSFTSSTDNLEYFILNPQESILYENYDYPEYKLIDNNITIDPENDIKISGFIDGNYYTFYNILRNKLGSSYVSRYYIKEISSDRTEIRLDSNTIDNISIIESTQKFIEEIQSTPYQKDFYLNFGQNILVIANNVLLDTSNVNDPTVLIKLYEPLPSQFGLKSELWVVEQLAESVAYNIQMTQRFDSVESLNYIKGPNLNIEIKDQINNPTIYKTYTDLSTSSSSSVQNQLNNILSQKGVNINVDYTDYANFIKFSSVQRRLENFYYKIQLIEEYTTSASLSGVSPSNYYLSSSQNVWQSKINDIISNFDGYEYFLYSTSGSKAYPKTNTNPPYILTGSADAYPWFLEQSTSGSEYDRENLDNLYSALPSYIQDDTTNEPLELFIDMLGQHYDNLWLYLQDVSNKFNADNRINYGVSKDLVADIIKDFGVKIYQNNFSSDDLYSAFFGFNSFGSYSLPTNATGGLNVEPNSFVEYITNYTTSSNSPIPLDDINKRIYKRIYHNLPYILNRKGTIEGLRALITSYGIPDTILRISEFGGKDKDNLNDWDYWYQHYNKAYLNERGNFISSSWRLNSDWDASSNVPNALAFRFKPESYPPTNKSQSLWATDGNAELWLEYNTSPSSGSYSGSIPSEYLEYGTLKFTPDGLNTASIYLPFFDGNWWSVLINSSSAEYRVYAKNNIYQGNDGSIIGYTGSAVLTTGSSWNNSISYWGRAATYGGYSGSFQELRFYTQPLSESVFDDFVMNPFSIEGNTLNSSPNELAFRAPLGSELNTASSSSIHPKATGSWDITSSFSSKNNYDYYISGAFVDNVEYVLVDQPPVGIKNRISDKIKTDDPIIEGTTLSSLVSIQQDKPISSSYTENVNYLEIAFSPQNEINDDIASQLGWFNIGDYIGDPRFISSSKDYYPLLNTLRDEYFLKYKNNYHAYDYIRLIKYFDNSLFKMIKDFIPSRTGLASGVVIKQHLLERNRYPQPQAEWTRPEYTASINQIPGLLDGARIYTASNEYESFPLYTFSGGTGGSLESFNTARGYFSGSVGTFDGSLNYFVNGTAFKNFFTLNSTITNNTLNLNTQEIFEYDSTRKIFKNTSGIPVRFDFELTAYNPSQTVGYLLFRLADQYGNAISKTYNTPEFDPLIDEVSAYLYNITIPKDGYFQIQAAEDNIPTGIGINDLSFKFNLYNIPADTAGEVWEEIIPTKVGNLTQSFQSEEQLYNGEFKGSVIDVISGSLLDNPYLLPQTEGVLYDVEIISGDSVKDENIAPGEFWIAVAGGKVMGIGVHPKDKNGGDHSFSLQNLINFTSELTGKGILTAPYGTVIYERGFTPTKAYYFQFSTPGVGTGFDSPNVPLVGTQTNIETFFDPPSYAGINFYNSDFNALINDVSNNRSSSTRYDVDYSSGGLVAVNYEAIKDGGAVKAQLQDYNYNALRSTRPRYIGSRNSTDAFNTGSTVAVAYSQSILNQSLQPSLFKQASVEQLNAAAYGINYGGGTSPEILGLGGTSLNSIYIVGNSPDAINVIPLSDPNYSTTIDTSLEPGDKVSIYQYKGNEAQVPTKLEVISTNVSVPPISSYMIPSTQGVGFAVFYSSSNSFKFNPGDGVYRVGRNLNGDYVDTNFLEASVFTSEFVNKFNSSPDDWYVSIYNTLDSPVIYSGSTATDPYQFLPSSSLEDPFGYYGVAKITNILNDSGTPEYGIYLDRDLSDLNGGEIGNDYGILIWESQGNSIIVKNSTLSGIGQGLIYSEYAPTTLTENLDYISKTYANNSN